ncbi:MAG TPA: VOC family protein [Mycobacteriales bacterium]|jgi:glyoxylase I family protein|nr:VOC family protein [Mycobacteriales bacterium]
MKLAGVHHVAINVRDVDEAVAFYVDRLGMTERADRPDFGFPGAWLDAGDRQVHLVQGDTPGNVGQHFALRLTDLDAAVAELRDAGVEVTDVIEVAPSSGRQAFLSDPSGNGIELNEAIV